MKYMNFPTEKRREHQLLRRQPDTTVPGLQRNQGFHPKAQYIRTVKAYALVHAFDSFWTSLVWSEIKCTVHTLARNNLLCIKNAGTQWIMVFIIRKMNGN
jgi:hypothetical protein